jgi:hypothetical protein
MTDASTSEQLPTTATGDPATRVVTAFGLAAATVREPEIVIAPVTTRSTQDIERFMQEIEEIKQERCMQDDARALVQEQMDKGMLGLKLAKLIGIPVDSDHMTAAISAQRARLEKICVKRMKATDTAAAEVGAGADGIAATAVQGSLWNSIATAFLQQMLQQAEERKQPKPP